MAGALVSRTGDEMSGPALLVAGLAVTGSPVLASALLAGLTASAAVGGPLLGVLLDRTRRPGRVLSWCLAGYGAGLLVVLAGLGRVPDAVLIGVAVVTGLLGPSLSGGWTAQLPLVVETARLPRANALDAMTYNLAGLAGPALVGLIATAAGGEAALVIGVALLAAALPAARMLPRRPEAREPAGAVREEIAAGFRAITGNRALLRATVTSMVSIAGLAMVVVAAPLLGQELLGDAGYGALLLAVMAGAALAANAVVARARVTWRWDTVLVVSTVLVGAGTLAAGLAGSFAAAVAASVVLGVGEGPQLTALFGIRHRESPDRVRSQVFTTGASLKITSFAAGSVLAGPLAAQSPALALFAGAAAQLLAVAAYGLLSLSRGEPTTDPAPPAQPETSATDPASPAHGEPERSTTDPASS